MGEPRDDIRAYIDGANLHKGIVASGWRLEHRRFRSWLRQKYGVSDARIFIGLMPKHAGLYAALQAAGFRLVYKEVLYDGEGRAKGNCDADLVLAAARDHFEAGIRSAVLVSSDGDYAPLVRFWQEKRVPCTILSPSPINKCSWLLRKTNAPIVCLNDVKAKLSSP